MNSAAKTLAGVLRHCAAGMAMDDRWITVHPNGSEGKGRPALIDESGTVKGGMGGKFNGQKISKVNKQSREAGAKRNAAKAAKAGRKAARRSVMASAKRASKAGRAAAGTPKHKTDSRISKVRTQSAVKRGNLQAAAALRGPAAKPVDSGGAAKKQAYRTDLGNARFAASEIGSGKSGAEVARARGILKNMREGFRRRKAEEAAAAAAKPAPTRGELQKNAVKRQTKSASEGRRLLRNLNSMFGEAPARSGAPDMAAAEARKQAYEKRRVGGQQAIEREFAHNPGFVEHVSSLPRTRAVNVVRAGRRWEADARREAYTKEHNPRLHALKQMQQKARADADERRWDRFGEQERRRWDDPDVDRPVNMAEAAAKNRAFSGQRYERSVDRRARQFIENSRAIHKGITPKPSATPEMTARIKGMIRKLDKDAAAHRGKADMVEQVEDRLGRKLDSQQRRQVENAYERGLRMGQR